MKLSTYRILGVVAAVLLGAAAVLAWAMGGCTAPIETAAGGQVPMKCHWTLVAATLIAALGAFSALGLAFVKCKVGRRWLAAGGVIAQVLVLAVLYTPLMGLCGDVSMRCHVTAAAVAAAGAAGAVLCIVAAVLADPKRAELPKRGL